jgi:putative zinc finger protein
MRGYFAGDLGADEARKLEEHVFECDGCAAAFEREGAMAAGLREQIPAVISHGRLAALERAGVAVQKNVIPPGRTVDVTFPAGLGLLINALPVSADDADRIDLTIRDPSGRPLVEVAAVPYDRGSGEVLIACQRHYEAQFPPLVRFELTAVKGTERSALGAWAVNHLWEH